MRWLAVGVIGLVLLASVALGAETTYYRSAEGARVIYVVLLDPGVRLATVQEIAAMNEKYSITDVRPYNASSLMNGTSAVA